MTMLSDSRLIQVVSVKDKVGRWNSSNPEFINLQGIFVLFCDQVVQGIN